LWAKLEARLDDKLREQFEVHQVNKYSPDEALQEMYELWLGSVARYTATQAQFENLESEVQWLSKSEAQFSKLKALALANQELKAQLEALQQLVQTKNEELDELSLENNELKLHLRPNQATNQIEVQQTQLNQLNQDLNSLHELWLEAVLQIPTATPSASASTTTKTDPLESYFQALAQLHQLTPVQKYDCAMKLFEQGMGPSEISRILAVNKGSLQHYKEGKRKRPDEE